MKTRKGYYLPFALAACALGAALTVDAQQHAATAEHTDERATLAKLRQARDNLSAVGEYEAALELGMRIVATLEEHAAVEMSDDLLELALLQARLEDYEAAELNCLRVIDMREGEHGIFSPALIAPFHALGRTYIDAGRFKDALVVLGRAQSISQRTQGLFNLEQIALIDDMTRAQLQSGDKSAAHALQVRRRDIAIRHFGRDAAELVPFYQHLGDYYHRHIGDYYDGWRSSDQARYQYETALQISNATLGYTSPASLELLRRLTGVELYRKRRTDVPDRLVAALRAATDISAKERGLSLAAVGDWATVNDDRASAERYYSQAYSALRGSADVDADDFFAAPAMLDFVPPEDDVDGANPFRSWNWGEIELELDVSATGRVTAVRTVSMEPHIDDLEDDYRKRIADTYFRPRLEQGRPVAGSDVRYTHEFRYYERD